jgi:N-acetylglucosamine malate deacetylase 2
MPRVNAGANRLNWLCGGAGRNGAPAVVLIAAHPDDEVIGAGSRLLAIPQACVIHVTDGAPRNMLDAARLGFDTPEDYALARCAEASASLAICGIGRRQMIELGFADQQAALNLVAVTGAIVRELQRIRPELVLTHAYEGGHPDHDATAFASHAAVRIWSRNSDHVAPTVVEFASYHARGEETCLLDFLPGDGAVITVNLSGSVRELKRQMIAAHVTQQATLCGFPLDVERFRVAPEYDFTLPPHPGRLNYERHDWGMSGERFRSRAAAALKELGLRPPL